MAERKRTGSSRGQSKARRAPAARRTAIARPLRTSAAETAELQRTLAERTREVEEKSAQLEAAQAELRDLMDNLDKLVRQRSRALVESEAELRRKNAELARLNKMKGEFVSIAAHELRTPLTSIVGYLDLMAEGRFGELPHGLRRPAESVRRNAHRLMRLVNEMLHASLIEAGRVSLSPRECDLVEIVRDAVNDLAPLAATKKHDLGTEFEDTPHILADPDKIQRVVANLLTNAIRYTPEGGTVVATVEPRPARDLRRLVGPPARARQRHRHPGQPARPHLRTVLRRAQRQAPHVVRPRLGRPRPVHRPLPCRHARRHHLGGLRGGRLHRVHGPPATSPRLSQGQR